MTLHIFRNFYYFHFFSFKIDYLSTIASLKHVIIFIYTISSKIFPIYPSLLQQSIFEVDFESFKTKRLTAHPISVCPKDSFSDKISDLRFVIFPTTFKPYLRQVAMISDSP